MGYKNCRKPRISETRIAVSAWWDQAAIAAAAREWVLMAE
jgi:hypothetical protein